MNEDIFDLEAEIKVLAGFFPEIEEVYIFGSRRYETKSTRSDIDILLVTNEKIKPSKLRDFTIEHNTALDLFILENGTATSVANESYITAENNEMLIQKVDGLLLYDKKNGSSQELNERKKIIIDKRVKHELTALPNGSADYYEVKALKKYFSRARENGLTAKPYLGTSTDEASDFIIEIMKNLISTNENVTGHGKAKGGWNNNLENEYDFQNLFWITIKPWLPGLSREQVALKYDDQEKRSDFSLFNDQLCIELKHIKDANDKREVVKTLESLKSFYLQHPNVRVLIFGILVNNDVELDDSKWEADFSYYENSPQVKTVIIRNK